MRLLLLAALLAESCAPLTGRGSYQIQLLKKPAGQPGTVRYLKAGMSADPVVNRTYAEDEMLLTCNGPFVLESEYESIGSPGMGGGLLGAEVWQVLRFRCAK